MFSKPTARVLAILDLFMSHPSKAYGLTELTRILGLNKATCHAILSTMARYGFLAQDSRSKAYRLGPSIAAAGMSAFAQFPVLEVARPRLEALSKELQLGCGLMGRSGDQLVLLTNYGIPEPLEFPFHQGLRLPNAAPLGAAFIAWSSPNKLQQWLDSAQAHLPEWDENLDKRLRISVIGIRARGFEVTLISEAEAALEQELAKPKENWSLEEVAEHVQHYRESLCRNHYHLDRIEEGRQYQVANIAVPIFASGEEPELVISAGSIRRPVSAQDILAIADRLKLAAKEISEAATATLSYPQPDQDPPTA